MYTWINKNHLQEATKAGNKHKLMLSGYFWHWAIAMKEALFLLAMFIGSVVHAFFPWVLDFKLLEWRINRLKQLKQKLPNDPQLKKVEFND